MAQSQEILGFQERLENQTEFQRADSTDAKVFLQIAQFPTKHHDHQYRHVNIDITHKTLTKEAKMFTQPTTNNQPHLSTWLGSLEMPRLYFRAMNNASNH